VHCLACGAENPPDSRFCGECGGDVIGTASAPSSSSSGSLATSLLVGSADDCDYVVADPTVSSHHLRVRPAGEDRVALEDLGSSNGTWLAGARISKVEVGVTDVVQLGLRPVEVSVLHAALRAAAAPGAGRTLVVGREDADLVLPFPVVSARHLEVRPGGVGLEVRDLGSTNGTFVNSEPVTGWTRVEPHASVQLGSYRVPEGTLTRWLEAVHSAPSDERPGDAAVAIPEQGEILIGRDPAADVTIDSAQVSWHHARITSEGSRWIIKDLGSTNGVFLNGSRIRAAALHPEDELRLGPVQVQLSEGTIVAPRRYEGEVRLDARNLVRIVGRNIRILDRVSVSIYPGELVALMGPSGAGKTTLLELLTGQRRPAEGEVLFNGQDLHDNLGSLRSRIGYVPQEDVMHRDLTVFEVLYHSARMRLPGDLPRSAVVEHVDRLITRMGLAHIRDQVVGGETRRGISGGQRKRVNIAIELITEPPLLFLDEPTSGLDSTSTLEVLQVLRSLADSGKTIVMTIHQPRVEAFRLVDSLILLAKGGKLAWFGPANPDPAEHFSSLSELPRDPANNPADYIIDVLDPPKPEMRRTPQQWQDDYLASPAYREYVVQRLGGDADVTLLPSTEGQSAPRRGVLGQYGNLLLRYIRRKWRDRAGLAIQLAQAPIVAILLGWLFFDSELPEPIVDPWTYDFTWPASGGVYPTLFLMVVASFWFGCSNVARELVSDRSVFRRERMAGLGVVPYLASVYTVQLALAAMQILVMVVIGWVLVGLHPLSIVPAFVLLMVTAAAGIGLGLLVSSVAPTEVTAIGVIPVILLPQLMLAGYLKLYGDMGLLQKAVTLLVPMRWSFEGLASVEMAVNDYDADITEVFGFPHIDLIHPFLDCGVLMAFTGLFCTLTLIRLLTMRTSS
jgi:ABC transport system ATP-binding/permease protein